MNTRQINIMVAGALAVFGLCACDDETTAAPDSPAISVLESGKKMDDCSKDNAGEMVYVSDSAAVFYCAEGKWQTLNGKDGAVGKDGADGKNGKNGQDGSSSRDTIVVNQKDTVVICDTIVVVNRDTVVIKESAESDSSSSEASLTGKLNWAYLNPAIDYGEMTDERDGQVYKTVKIGDQVWMAENLNFEYKFVDENTGEEKSIGSYCNEDDCLKFGRYYIWSAAMDSAGAYSEKGKDCGFTLTCTPVYPVRGVCPKGWHLPDSSEWKALYESVSGKKAALLSMSFEANWPIASNASGFSAIPAGYYYGGILGAVGGRAHFWSATEIDDEAAYEWGLDGSSTNLYDDNKKIGNSVRCIQD